MMKVMRLFKLIISILILGSCISEDDKFDWECTAEYRFASGSELFFDKEILDKFEDSETWCDPYNEALAAEVGQGKIEDLLCKCEKIPE